MLKSDTLLTGRASKKVIHALENLRYKNLQPVGICLLVVRIRDQVQVGVDAEKRKRMCNYVQR